MPKRALAGWVLFDWAFQPFFTLISTFIFAPYFVSAVTGNEVWGQALWGYATAAAGLMLAVLAPTLGCVADASGPKKPWIAGCAAIVALCCALLWLAVPQSPAGLVLMVLMLYVIATIAAEIAAVFNNAMMISLVPHHHLGRLSGLGWALGYLGGLVALGITLLLLAGEAQSGRTLAGIEPLFGLDPSQREGDRAVGPLSALWLIVFLVPLFVFTPDLSRTALTYGQCVKSGWRSLKATLLEARKNRPLVRFLIANMLYQDGLAAVFAFGGIYGAGLFGWGATELGLFGILLTLAGVFGALAGGRFDDLLGSRLVIQTCLVALGLVCAGLLLLGKNHVLFFEVAGPGAPLYGSMPEKVFVLLGLVIGLVAGPLQASSRSLLARMIEPEEGGRYFGLLALSGKVTSFLGPLLVALATTVTGSIAAGPAILLPFFVLSFVLVRRI